MLKIYRTKNLYFAKLTKVSVEHNGYKNGSPLYKFKYNSENDSIGFETIVKHKRRIKGFQVDTAIHNIAFVDLFSKKHYFESKIVEYENLYKFFGSNETILGAMTLDLLLANNVELIKVDGLFVYRAELIETKKHFITRHQALQLLEARNASANEYEKRKVK